jgi:CheY-like chemotaxis protein
MSRVLILSSDPAFKEKNSDVLRQAGLEVTAVADCLQGLQFLGKDKFGIVVIDTELSDMSGSQACRIIRQQTGVPIILLGTVAEHEVWAKAGELGFDLYLKKHVSPNELLARMQALLRHPPVERKPLTASQPSGLLGTKKPAMQLASKTPPQISSAKTPNLLSRFFGRPRLSESASPAVPAGKQLQQKLPQLPLDRESRKSPDNAESKQTGRAPKDIPGPASEQSRLQLPSQQTPVTQLKSELPPRGRDVHAQKRIKEDEEVNGQQDATLEAQPAAIFEDARILKLVDALVNGKLVDIAPTIDFNLKEGYSYPAVEGFIDTSGLDTINILSAMADAGVLIKQKYEKFNVDPEGLFQLVPVEHCPKDDSTNLIRGQLVEHFACGYVALDRDFRQESRYVCPKCRKEMRLIGTDYRNIGMHYQCQVDGEIFTTPVIKWRNLKTRKEWTLEELREVDVYSYSFNPDKRSWLEFLLKPKAQLVAFLQSRGYDVQEFAQLKGRSGAMHTFDILAVRDDILTKLDIGIGILAAGVGETEVGLEALFRFDTHAYDAGISYKVVIAIPKLGHEAANFAKRQMINAFESKTMDSVVSDITGVPTEKQKMGMDTQPEMNITPAAKNARSTIANFLRKKGYEVYEKALISGKSGVDHVFDIFARIDDRIIVPTIAVGIVSAGGGNQTDRDQATIFDAFSLDSGGIIHGSGDHPQVGMDQIAMFDAAAFDSGIRNKVFLGLPEIGPRARQYAKQQRIDVIEQKDLDKLV